MDALPLIILERGSEEERVSFIKLSPREMHNRISIDR